MPIDQAIIDSAILKAEPNCTAKEKEEYSAAIRKIVDESIPMKEALNISEESLEYYYNFAYQLFTAGQYKKAAAIFAFLSLVDGLNPKYYLALGACQHRMKNYTGALDSYMGAYYSNIKDPLPFYYISDCYIKLDKLDYAGFSLGMVIHMCGNNPVYKQLKDRCEITLAALGQKIDEELNEQEKKNNGK